MRKHLWIPAAHDLVMTSYRRHVPAGIADWTTLSFLGSHRLYGWWLVIYVLCNNISVIWGQWAGDNERLCALESRLRFKRYPPQAGLEPGTPRSVGQRLPNWATLAIGWNTIIHIYEYGYTTYSSQHFFSKGDTLSDFPFACLSKQSLPKRIDACC